MAVSTPPQREQRKSPPRWSNLFFIKRLPKLRGVPFDWEHPADEAEFQKMVESDGFVSSSSASAMNLSYHPIVRRDLRDLEEYLLPVFFAINQRAKYFQNQFYLFQWIFIFGAFATTVLGAIATLLYQSPTGSVADIAAAQRDIVAGGLNTQQLVSAATAIVGFITVVITTLNNRGEPQKRWGRARRLTEELRMTYFTYLSHLPPYDTDSRLQKLRQNVLEIRQKEQENV